jgi:hypothetical protein
MVSHNEGVKLVCSVSPDISELQCAQMASIFERVTGEQVPQGLCPAIAASWLVRAEAGGLLDTSARLDIGEMYRGVRKGATNA